MAMPQQTLDSMNIHTGFQQVRGKGMAQGVDAALTPQPGAISRRAVDALCHLDIDRPIAGWVGE